MDRVTLELYHLVQPPFIVGDCCSGDLLGLLVRHGGPHLLGVVVGEQLHDGVVLLAVDDDVAGPVAILGFNV